MIVGPGPKEVEKVEVRLGAYEEFRRRLANGLGDEIRQHQIATAEAMARADREERERERERERICVGMP